MFISHLRLGALALFAAITLHANAAPVLGVYGNSTAIPPGAPPDLLTGTNFGDVPIGVTFASTYFLENFEGTPGSHVQLISIILGGPDAINFALAKVPSSFDIPFLSNVELQVHFTPKKAGPHNATLTLISNDPAHPQYVFSLSGNGVQQTAPLPDLTVRFAEELQGEANVAKGFVTKKVLVEVSNSGNDTAEKASLLVFTQPDFPFHPGTARLLKKKRVKNLAGNTTRQFILTLKVPIEESIAYFLVAPDVVTNERNMRDNITVVGFDTH